MKTTQVKTRFIASLISTIKRGLLQGMAIAIGFFGTTILAVAISGTVKTWTTGEVLKSSDLNTTITSLKTAIEGIPNWTKSGSKAYYTDGNVGIGTSSPTKALEIRNDSNPQLIIGHKSASSYSMQIGHNGGFDAVTGGGGTNIVFNIDGSTKLFISNGGLVGIGTTSPSHILHINGAGRSTQAAWDTTSDERLKDIKGSYKKGLKELMGLSPIAFQYKKENPLSLPSVDEKIGIGAQSLHKVLPEAVKKQKDGYLTVNNDPIFWAMLNSIKELKTISDSEKAANEKKFSALEEENRKLRIALDMQNVASLRLAARLRVIENSQIVKK